MAIRINLSTISALQCSRTLCTSSSPERGRATPTPWAPTPRKAPLIGRFWARCGTAGMASCPGGTQSCILRPTWRILFFFEFFVSQGGHEPYELWHFLMQQPAQTMGITRYYKCLLLFNHNWHKNPHVDVRNGESSITWMTLCDFSASLKDIIHRKPWVQNMSGKLRKLGDVPIKYECVQCFSSDFPGKKA